MDRSKTFDRLGELPDSIATPLRLALERTASFEVTPRAENDWTIEESLYRTALLAAGLPWQERRDAGGPVATLAHRPIPRASELGPEQRVVAEIVAYVEGAPLNRSSLPASAWVRRQWLGLDPKGPLFALEIGGQPAYHAVRDAVRSDRAAAAPLIQALPLADRIALLVELELAKLDHGENAITVMLREAGPTIGADAGAWARVQADRLLALFAPDVPSTERGNARQASLELRRPVFLALARAGVPIEPRWDMLVPVGPFLPPAETAECVDAIPAERREAALETAVRRPMFFGDASGVTKSLLARWPYGSLARVILEKVHRASKPKDVLKELKTLVANDPAMVAEIAAKEAELASVASLTRGPVRSGIALADLDATDRAQLERSNQLFGGKQRSVEQLYAEEKSGDEQIVPSLTSHFRIDRAGVPVYDAWMSMGDSGTIFAFRTTDVVAEIVQGGVERADGALRSALAEVIAGWREAPSPRQAAKRAPAKGRKASQRTKPAKPPEAKAPKAPRKKR